MKIKLGTGKGILLLIITALLPFSLFSEDLTNKELNELMKEAQAYFDDQDYDNAIRILTDLVNNNPDRLDQAVNLMEKIREIRNLYNKKYEELITALYEDEDPERALELIEEMEALEKNPNEVSRRAIRNARISAELVYNKIALREIMDNAKIQLDLKEYGNALALYESGFDLGKQTYEESELVSDIQKDAVKRSIDEIYAGAVAYISNETALRSRIEELGRTIEDISSDSLDARLAPIIEDLGGQALLRDEFYRMSGIIDDNLDIIVSIDKNAPERYFLDFAQFLIFGHPASDFFEGIISAADLFWEDRFAALTDLVDDVMTLSYFEGLSAYQAGDLQVAESHFGDTLNYAEASISLYNLLYRRIRLDKTLELDDYGAYLVESYYGNLVDARVLARATDSFGKMITLRRSLDNYNLSGELTIEELYAMRLAVTSDIPLIDEETALWSTIGSSLDWLAPYEALPERSDSVYSQAAAELNRLKDEMKTVNLAILTRLTDQEYDRISSALETYRSDYGEADRLIEGIVDPDVAAYTGNSELLSTFPDRALPGLVALAENLTRLLNETESVLNTFSEGEALVDEGGKIADFISKTEDLIPQINSLGDDTDSLETVARDNIFSAEGYENQGNKLLETVRAIVRSPRATRESFDRARESIKDANNAYYQSFTFKENLPLRRRADSEMAALQQELIDGENRLVVADVRSYINQGKQAYVNRQYSRARVFLERAQNRWLTTNAEEHPEVQYWLALVDLALQFDRGRTISRTEPLYEEMTQFLNLAYGNFNRGVNLLARGDRDAGVEALNQAIANIENVEIHMPRNESASLLRLKIAQLIDPEQFRASFSERINSAWEKLRSTDKSTQGEGYTELIDLSKIDADYPGLQNKISIAEYDILKTKLRPPNPRDLAESKEFYLQAYAIVEQGIRNQYPAAISYLDKAIEKNPDNEEAIKLKDKIQIDTGGQTTIFLTSALESRFREAVLLFEQDNALGALLIIRELKANPESAKYPPLLQLEERVLLKTGQ